MNPNQQLINVREINTANEKKKIIKSRAGITCTINQRMQREKKFTNYHLHNVCWKCLKCHLYSLLDSDPHNFESILPKNSPFTWAFFNYGKMLVRQRTINILSYKFQNIQFDCHLQELYHHIPVAIRYARYRVLH